MSPSLTMQTTEVCGPPSRFSVVTMAKFRLSSSSRVSSLNATDTSSPFSQAFTKASPVPALFGMLSVWHI